MADLPSNLTYSHKCVCTIHKQFLLLMYKLYTIFVVVVHVIFILFVLNLLFFSLEIAAIVCGVPVMISDCEQDIDMREKEPTSVVETNLVKNSGNMELDMSLNTKETSDCEIHNKMNQLKDTDLHNVYFEKNFDDMELEDSVSNKIIKTPTVETVHELKEDVAHEALEKNKINIETLTSNNGKTTESVNFDIVTAVQERKHADLCAEHSGKDSAKMEIENYASEKPVITSSAGQTLIDVESVNELKGGVTVHEALEKNKVNIETSISNNEKATESHKFDILNEVQERKEAVLCEDHSDKNMEIESYTSGKPVATPSACQTSVDVEKQKQPSWPKEEEYENSTLDISTSDKEMICVPGKIIIFFVLMFVINSLITLQH